MKVETKEFEKGRTYYTRGGRMVEYLAASNDGHHVVAELHEVDTYDGPSMAWGNTVFETELYESPPRALYDKTIENAEKKIRELEERRASIQADILKQASEAQKRLDKLKSYRGLELVEDFIDGKITHVVIETYGDEMYKVMPFEELNQISDDKYRKPEGIKLISLFGKAGGDLQWMVSAYRDGSGGWSKIEPCQSEAGAVEKRKQLLGEALKGQWSGYVASHDYHFRRAFRAAVAAGIEPTAEQQAAFDVGERRDAEKKRADLERQLTEIQTKLEALPQTQMEAA
jgi:hypothetical protein